MLKQTTFLVVEKDPDNPKLILAVCGARLTFEAAQSLCKLGPNRAWMKMVATKEIGASKFDPPAKQQEKQHGNPSDQPPQG